MLRLSRGPGSANADRWRRRSPRTTPRRTSTLPPAPTRTPLARSTFHTSTNSSVVSATRTIQWLLYTPGLFSSISGPSVAIPDAPMPGHRATLARTIRYISGAGRHGLSYTRQSAGYTITGYCDASHGREMHQAASGFCKSRSEGCIAASGASIHAFSQAQQSWRRSWRSGPSSPRSSC